MSSVLSGSLRAELLRTKGSAAMWLPLLGLLIGSVSMLFSLSSGTTGSALVAQGLYITGMAAPLSALFACLVASRERTARSGGTLWRDYSRSALRGAQVLVLAGLLGIFTVLCFGVTLALSLAHAPGEAPSVILAAALCWLSQVGVLCFFLPLARAMGTGITLLASVGWQVLGVLFAESARWWLVPPAWPVRLLLPVLDTHASLVPLAPGETPPALHTVLLACVFFCAASAAGAVLLPQVSLPRLTLPGLPAMRFSAARRSPLLAVALVARRRGIYPLIALTCLGLGYTARAYPPITTVALSSFLLLPLGTALLAVLSWGALSPAWVVSVLHNPVFRRATTAWHLGVVGLLCLCAAGTVAFAGMPLRDVALHTVLWCATGFVLVMLWLWLTVRFSGALTLGLSVVVTVVSLTLGGDVLAGTRLWVIALPSWGYSAMEGTRPLVALTICAVLLAVLLPALHRSYRCFEGRS
ncbi:hypothetical protein [Corynebacterium lowii]|uniref:ABC-2 family transporter protein n=1 Tax=Corynebacterium lowii TaxID=1544413 RepID=A0A0Q0UJ57_9CORY|nr:hypothetical protein [Corynebacterium lowii]KQB86257.1 ABC-2 family transporter protein [Corynebacterium lowii]MDP9850742.1 ABC-2 type transport system permease protein [Corynebacterium lowii]